VTPYPIFQYGAPHIAAAGLRITWEGADQRGCTDGQAHIPGFNSATTAYTGEFVGFGFSSLKVGGMYTYSNSALINNWSIKF
jgi:hypothetical protein